jgi:hypothetical protein
MCAVLFSAMLAALVAGLEPAPAKSAGATPEVLLLAAGDLRGEIKPCGCSPEGQMGGLPRRLTYLEQAVARRRAPVLRVDLGNNFPAPSPQGRLKVDYIQAMLKRAGLDAILPGPNELALGMAALDPELPYVASNLAGPAPLPARRVVNAGGRAVAILGYLSPDQVYQGPQSALRLLRVDGALLARWRAELEQAGASAAVLLFRGGDKELEVFAGSRLFTAIVAGNPSDDELHQVTERRVAGTEIPQVPTKGQGVLRLRLGQSDPPAVDWLGDGIADHPDAVKAMAAYDERVKALFFEQVAVAEAHRKASPYAGAEVCKACHLPAYIIWKGAKHSQAIAELQRVGKQFDPECLACHVVGLGGGGYISQDTTPELANVQCENCHGPAKAHAADPAVRPVPPAGATARGLPGEGTCRTCHKGSHSPAFDFASYWPKILHMGPGMTLAPTARK